MSTAPHEPECDCGHADLDSFWHRDTCPCGRFAGNPPATVDERERALIEVEERIRAHAHLLAPGSYRAAWTTVANFVHDMRAVQNDDNPIR